jgi:hypothetical protein
VGSRSAALPLSHAAARQKNSNNKNNTNNNCHAFFLALSLVAAIVLVYSSHHAILDVDGTTIPTTTMQHGFDPTTGGGMSALLWQSSQQASSFVASLSSSHLIAQLANFKARPSFTSLLQTQTHRTANWTIANDEEENGDDVVDISPQQQESSPLLFDRPNKPIVVAYVVTFPHKCEDDAIGTNATAWLLDAIIVLRHGLHLTTARGGNRHSHYDYHLIALVDAKAADHSCSPLLHQSGAFAQVVVKEPPVYGEQIVGKKGHVARKMLHRKGTTEFLPLYSYEMTDYPIVVHVDLDVAFVKPLDDVFDVMLYHPESHIGRAARTRLVLEPVPPQQPPNQQQQRIVPVNIQAALTLDWPQVMPGRKPGVRPGLLIVKPNPHVLALLIDVIRQGDYVDGYGRDNGWGGRGHGGYTGALGLSGLLAYVYETLLYDTYVELNQCQYNHIGMDVLYRANPSFRPNHKKVGQCRNDGDYCEDCMTTPTTQSHTVRFGGKGIGGCPPPWHCIGEGSRSSNGRHHDETNSMIPEDQVDLQHCLELQGIWHGLRRDFESKLYDLTSAETIRSVGQAGEYLPHVYNGHCHRLGAGGYNKIAASVRTLQRVPDLYK